MRKTCDDKKQTNMITEFSFTNHQPPHIYSSDLKNTKHVHEHLLDKSAGIVGAALLLASLQTEARARAISRHSSQGVRQIAVISTIYMLSASHHPHGILDVPDTISIQPISSSSQSGEVVEFASIPC